LRAPGVMDTPVVVSSCQQPLSGRLPGPTRRRCDASPVSGSMSTRPPMMVSAHGMVRSMMELPPVVPSPTSIVDVFLLERPAYSVIIASGKALPSIQT
jgi:hypothetical protein